MALGRSRWRELLGLAQTVASAIRAGGEPERFAWEDFRRRLNSTPASGLPLERWGVSGSLAVQAFLAAGKGLLVAQEPERRTAFAVLTHTSAQLVDAMLDQTATEDAQASWGRQFPKEFD